MILYYQCRVKWIFIERRDNPFGIRSKHQYPKKNPAGVPKIKDFLFGVGFNGCLILIGSAVTSYDNKIPSDTIKNEDLEVEFGGN